MAVMILAERSAASEAGCNALASRLAIAAVTCTWASIKPGMRTRPPRSMRSAEALLIGRSRHLVDGVALDQNLAPAVRAISAARLGAPVTSLADDAIGVELQEQSRSAALSGVLSDRSVI
jgi:hypothetical protein